MAGALSLARRIDDEYAALIDSFVSLVRASSIQTHDIGQHKGTANDMVDVMGGQLVETAGNVLALLNELKLTVAVSEHVAAQQAQDAAHAQLQQSIEHMQEQICSVEAELAKQRSSK